jgi:hypothetical protein
VSAPGVVDLSGSKCDSNRILSTPFCESTCRAAGSGRQTHLFVSGSAFFVNLRDQLIPLVVHQKIPAIYAWRELAVAGGLMSYGTNVPEAYRQAGIYTKVTSIPPLRPSPT